MCKNDNSISVRLNNQLIWNQNESEDKFKTSLTKPEIQSLINNFMKADHPLTSSGIETAVAEVNNILTSTAKISLKIKRVNQIRRKRKHAINTKWFDKEYNAQRIELRCLSNKKHRDPSDLIIREKYHTELQSYKMLLKKKKLSYDAKKLSELEDEKDPREFWKLIKSMDDKEARGDKPPIMNKDWLNHF